MKQALAFVALVAVAVGVWILRGNNDASLIGAKDAQILAMNDTLQAKEKLRVQDETLLDARDTSIKTLQDKIKSGEDLLAKNEAQIESDKTAYQRLQDGDQNIINSLKADNNSDIQTLKDQIQDKDEQIAQLNEKLVQTISQFESELNTLRSRGESTAENDDKIYPKDNGFDLQDVGTGFFSYRYFGDSVRNPNNAQLPPVEPNLTPWTFIKDAGVAANGCGFYVTNAPNGDSDGKTSRLGQAAFLQFKDSAISQMIELPAGTFSVSLSYEARRDYTPNEIQVSIDGHILFTGGPLATDHFIDVTSDSIKLAAGKHELKFLALGDGVDVGFPCTFIDNVSINVLGSHHKMNDAKIKISNQETALEHP